MSTLMDDKRVRKFLLWKVPPKANLADPRRSYVTVPETGVRQVQVAINGGTSKATNFS